MRQEKHMMDNHAKRNLRGLVASAIFGAVLVLGSGTASATPFLVDFNVAPFAGNPTVFSSGGFDFLFTGAGDGGDFAISAVGGEGGTGGIDTLSGAFNIGTEEVITIKLTGGGTFTWNSIYLDILAGSVMFPAQDTIVEGLLVAATPFSTTILAGATPFVGTVNTGGVLVDTVQIRSLDIAQLIFDSFAGDLQMDMQPVPEPGTLALFVIGLFGLGLLSRRRRQPMA